MAVEARYLDGAAALFPAAVGSLTARTGEAMTADTPEGASDGDPAHPSPQDEPCAYDAPPGAHTGETRRTDVPSSLWHRLRGVAGPAASDTERVGEITSVPLCAIHEPVLRRAIEAITPGPMGQP